MEVKELIKKDFDGMENKNPEVYETIGLFTDDKDKNAHKKIMEYLSTLKITPYLGWDGEVYPKFKVNKKEIL